jgi:hypothetical protein
LDPILKQISSKKTSDDTRSQPSDNRQASYLYNEYGSRLRNSATKAHCSSGDSFAQDLISGTVLRHPIQLPLSAMVQILTQGDIGRICVFAEDMGRSLTLRTTQILFATRRKSVSLHCIMFASTLFFPVN